MVDPSIANDRVLYEAERWFRAKLRGETVLHTHEVALFKAMAELRNAREDVYVSRDGETLRPSTRASESERLPTTRPPPPNSQEELLRVSRREYSLTGGDPIPEALAPPPLPRRRGGP